MSPHEPFSTIRYSHRGQRRLRHADHLAYLSSIRRWCIGDRASASIRRQRPCSGKCRHVDNGDQGVGKVDREVNYVAGRYQTLISHSGREESACEATTWRDRGRDAPSIDPREDLVFDHDSEFF